MWCQDREVGVEGVWKLHPFSSSYFVVEFTEKNITRHERQPSDEFSAGTIYTLLIIVVVCVRSRRVPWVGDICRLQHKMEIKHPSGGSRRGAGGGDQPKR